MHVAQEEFCIYFVFYCFRFLDFVFPVILNCPDDFEVLADPSHPLGFATWTEPTTSDVTGRTHRIYRSYRPSSMLPVGENDVIYVFSDENDNRATCTFKVTVTSGMKIVPNDLNTMFHSLHVFSALSHV